MSERGRTQTKPTGMAVSFSGHRPEKLPAGRDRAILQSMVYQETAQAISDGACVFYSGMSRGLDLYAAELVLAMRSEHPEIRLVCACPFPAFFDSFSPVERYRVDCILSEANDVCFISKHYYSGVFFARNRYMVDHSDRLIAVMLDPRSGTGNTVRYAQKKGKDVRIVTLPIK